ncbi:MAG: nicotinamide riboside transporter PnuC [Bacteroidota bacterium]
MQVPEPVFWVETGAAVLGVWGVWDLGSGLRRGYISGMVSTFAYVFLCAWNGIYADAVINVWYTVMGAVGWLAWKKRTGENTVIPIQSITAQGLVWGLVLGVCAWLLFGYLLMTYTDSSIVWWDATTSALAITAMVWMAAGYTWNWPLWLIINFLSVGLYLYKGMVPTALQYLVFGFLAIRGWRIWNRPPAR